MTESRSGETCRPQTSASSPVLTTTLSADGSSVAARPRRSLAAPVPPARATTRMGYSVPVRETEGRRDELRGDLEGIVGTVVAAHDGPVQQDIALVLLAHERADEPLAARARRVRAPGERGRPRRRAGAGNRCPARPAGASPRRRKAPTGARSLEKTRGGRVPDGGIYFLPSTASFTLLVRRNLHTRLAGILIGSPVCGLRPIRALRFASTSFPKPGRTKPFFASLQASARVSSKISTICRFERLVLPARCAMTADLLIIFATGSPPRWSGMWRELVSQPAAHGYRSRKRNSPEAIRRRYEPKRASASSTASSGESTVSLSAYRFTMR